MEILSDKIYSDKLYIDSNVVFNIETNLGKFNNWGQIPNNITNIILYDYDLRVYAIPSFITKFEKLENITFADYNFDNNEINFDESFEIIKNLLENKNIKINNCNFNIFLGDYYGNQNNHNESIKYYLINHESDINAASKMSDYYLYESAKYSIIVYNLLKNINQESCKTVYYVSLEYMNLIKLPSQLEFLINLQTLNLGSNNLTKLPDSIGSLINLQSLNVGINFLTELNNNIGMLVNLRLLILRGNKINFLPDTIGLLTKLESLNLEENNLIKLPDTIGDLISLQYLNLSENQLIELPDNIGKLSNLKSFDLRYNTINKVPDTIGALNNLQLLNLSWNAISELFNNNNNNNNNNNKFLAKLESLNLRYNKLTKLYINNGYLGNLQILELSNNNLIKLSNTIGLLTKLRSLNLYNNKLIKLPNTIGLLTKLESLNIYNNKLIKLPNSISMLFNLKLLSLYNNQIFELPQSFYKISNNCYLITDNEILLNNLPNNLTHLCIEYLELPIVNLPSMLLELKLKDYKINPDKIKLPYGCKIIKNIK